MDAGSGIMFQTIPPSALANADVSQGFIATCEAVGIPSQHAHQWLIEECTRSIHPLEKVAIDLTKRVNDGESRGYNVHVMFPQEGRMPQELIELRKELLDALDRARRASDTAGSRALSLSITKIEEAILWLTQTEGQPTKIAAPGAPIGAGPLERHPGAPWPNPRAG